jgi:hypothetical protein
MFDCMTNIEKYIPSGFDTDTTETDTRFQTVLQAYELIRQHEVDLGSLTLDEGVLFLIAAHRHVRDQTSDISVSDRLAAIDLKHRVFHLLAYRILNEKRADGHHILSKLIKEVDLMDATQ